MTESNYREIDLTLETAQNRCIGSLAEELQTEVDCLLSALPGMRKSSGTPEAVATTDVPITILTARKELYEQIQEWCDDHGLTNRVIPSFHRVCPSAAGKYSDALAEHLMEIYSRGVPSRLIHDPDTSPPHQPLPCQQGMECSYHREMKMLSADAYDVLIGHYTHAYVKKLIEDRVVVIDEFPGTAYVRSIDADTLPRAVSTWLHQQDDIPYSTFADLLENRQDSNRRSQALEWFDEHGVKSDPSSALDSELVHADTPIAVFILLNGEKLGNGWERAAIRENAIGVFNRESNETHVLRQPDLGAAGKVLALDGTPTLRLWELVLGSDLNYRQVLSDTERKAYIWNALGHRIYQTTTARKPYSSGNFASVQQDHALITAVRDKYGQRPGLISSKKVIEGDETNPCYDDAGVLDEVSAFEWRGNLIGSNQFKDERVGVVAGSAHYGDEYIERWGAFAGKAVTPSKYAEHPGEPRQYGEFGNKVRTHMAEHGTLQEILRFGRDGQGARVFVHTSAIPDWVPLAGQGRVVSTRSEGMQEIIETAQSLDKWTTSELTEQVSIGERQVRKHLQQLHADGFLDRETEGRGYVWRDTGLHEVNEHGKVELSPISQEKLTDEEVAELARSTINTWEFRNITPSNIYSVQRGVSPDEADSFVVISD